ncbi:uncharacterized protein lekr1 isoform X2 [Mobula birostris]|uniref:uncharacterized protein lekr1 isoform X2 n=1 Tax=Mobula birostris TaxID=1983395 RepID=UPI003B285B8B
MVMWSSSELLPKQSNMERHIPVHPLPEDIQQMPQNETVCKYCGVSYLIHHEMKLMEEKLKAMEAELEFYCGSVAREKTLQRELCSINQCMAQLKNDNHEKKESLNFLNGQLAAKQKELEDTFLQMEGVSDQLIEAQSQLKLYRERAKQQGHIVKQAATFLQGIRTELTMLKEDVRGNLMIWDPFSKTLARCLKVTNSSIQMEIFQLQESLKRSNEEVDALQNQVKELHVTTTTVALQSQQINDLAQKKTELEIRCHDSQEQALVLEKQLITQQLNFQKVTEEMERYKELLLDKSEVEDLLSKINELECAHEEQRSRYCKEIKEKEEKWLHFEQKYKSLEEQLEEKVRKETEVENQTSKSLGELLTLQTTLSQAEEKLAALTQEREQMIISHQNRIEQLQENFRQNLRNEESWREKVPELVSTATSKLHMEVNRMKSKLEETQCQITQKDHYKDDEISKLVKINSQLEIQLKQEQNKAEFMNEGFRSEMRQKSAEIRESKQEILQLKEALDQAEKENTFLAETVRRECEERYELTEALSQAKEQLMELKRLSGEPSPSYYSISQRSISSSSSNQECKTQRSPSNSSRSKVNGFQEHPAKAISLHSSGCSALPAIPIHHPSKGSTLSASEIKQRIAAAVKRK